MRAGSFGSDQRLTRRADVRPAHAGRPPCRGTLFPYGIDPDPRACPLSPHCPPGPHQPCSSGSHLQGSPASLLRLQSHVIGPDVPGWPSCCCAPAPPSHCLTSSAAAACAATSASTCCHPEGLSPPCCSARVCSSQFSLRAIKNRTLLHHSFHLPYCFKRPACLVVTYLLLIVRCPQSGVFVSLVYVGTAHSSAWSVGIATAPR